LRLKLERKEPSNIFPMMKTTAIDHNMKWQPAAAAYGLGIRLSVTGLFEGELGQNSVAGDSRFIRQ
jgi:hypothetical protein